MMRHARAVACLTSLSILNPGIAYADPLRDSLTAEIPGLIELYHDLHAHPELSGAETRTAAILAQEARKAGFDVTTGVGGTGVVAVLRNGPGPVLLIRTDMDALPVTEVAKLPYASAVRITATGGTTTGVMHACGHDTHMASWVATARRLAAMRHQWSGTLVMVAQPAEEIGTGAAAMLKDGLYARFPKPDVAIAFHNSASLAAGVIGYADNFVTANVDAVDIRVRGVGGHGAYPQSAKDPIVLASRIVLALQTLVSRELDPLDSGVVTVGTIVGGSKRNVIPDEVLLQLTLRSYSPHSRRTLVDGVGRIARGEAIAAGIPADLMPIVSSADVPVPVMRNSEPFTQDIAKLFMARFGANRVQTMAPQMGGEDFSHYGLASPNIKTMLFFVGGVSPEKWQAAGGDVTKLPGLHSAQWEPDAPTVIETASEALITAALSILAPH